MQDRFKFRYFNQNDSMEEISLTNCYYTNLDYSKLMQSIGLKDKNGKLIYEGDIVKIFHVSGTMQGKYFFDVVEWNDLRCRFDTEKYGIINDDDVYEVIGNIYENPELLKEEG